MKKIINKLKKFKNDGFTLVEMLIYMGLLSMFIIILSGLFAAVFSTKLTGNAQSYIDQDSKFILARISNDIRRSDLISSPSANLEGNNNSNILELKINSDNYRYYLKNENLIVSKNGSDEIMNSSETKIEYLKVQRIGSSGISKDLIKIVFGLNNRGGTFKDEDIKEFRLTVGLR